jgi:pyrroloquinoline quinone (PQQ) biosynthesis protein C
MSTVTNKVIDAYARKNHLQGLTKPSLISIIEEKPGYSANKAKQFLQFQKRINDELLTHEVIVNNHFTRWFRNGEMSETQIKAFVVQFSVFSNLFLIAQLYKMINADSLEGMRASKEILTNEIGVVFNPASRPMTKGNVTDITDPELVSTEGTVEGGTFRFKAAHFEWLLLLAEKLGLTFNDVGKRHHGIHSTLLFCDELVRLYGSADYLTSQAASYAVENWAAAGFWDELVEGFEIYNRHTGANLPLSFFSWHAKLEAQHALHTQEELEELYFATTIDEDKFIRIGREMLDGVATFWSGLNEQRQKIASTSQ